MRKPQVRALGIHIFLGLESSPCNKGSSVKSCFVRKTSPVLTILVNDPTLVPDPRKKFAQFYMYFYFFALSKSSRLIMSSKGSKSERPESVKSNFEM